MSVGLSVYFLCLSACVYTSVCLSACLYTLCLLACLCTLCVCRLVCIRLCVCRLVCILCVSFACTLHACLHVLFVCLCVSDLIHPEASEVCIIIFSVGLPVPFVSLPVYLYGISTHPDWGKHLGQYLPGRLVCGLYLVCLSACTLHACSFVLFVYVCWISAIQIPGGIIVCTVSVHLSVYFVFDCLCSVCLSVLFVCPSVCIGSPGSELRTFQRSVLCLSPCRKLCCVCLTCAGIVCLSVSPGSQELELQMLQGSVLCLSASLCDLPVLCLSVCPGSQEFELNTFQSSVLCLSACRKLCCVSVRYLRVCLSACMHSADLFVLCHASVCSLHGCQLIFHNFSPLNCWFRCRFFKKIFDNVDHPPPPPQKK